MSTSTNPASASSSSTAAVDEKCDVVAGLAEPDGTLRERFTVRLHRAVAP